jgi:hypothetical protein
MPLEVGGLKLQTQLFINNEFVDAKSGTTFNTVNPATEVHPKSPLMTHSPRALVLSTAEGTPRFPLPVALVDDARVLLCFARRR